MIEIHHIYMDNICQYVGFGLDVGGWGGGGGGGYSITLTATNVILRYLQQTHCTWWYLFGIGII